MEYLLSSVLVSSIWQIKSEDRMTHLHLLVRYACQSGDWIRFGSGDAVIYRQQRITCVKKSADKMNGKHARAIHPVRVAIGGEFP